MSESTVDPHVAVEDLAHLLARIAGVRRAVAWDAAAFELPDLHQASALVQQHQPVDPPAIPVTQGAFDSLLVWAAARGARLAPALRLTATPHGARVVATTPIAAGAPLVEVPLVAMVRTSDVLADHPTLGPWLAGAPLFGPGTLMLWLVCARHGGGAADPWAPYVAALPAAVPGTAVDWPRSPGHHLIAATMGRSFLAGVLQLYCLVYRRLLGTDPAQRPLPLEAFTLQRWLWAGAILSSRQSSVTDELALVPLWDLFDHDEALGAETTSLVGDTLRCTAGVDYPAGAAVAMYYGRRTPTERWVYGGFAPPGPPDSEPAAVPFGLPAAAPLRRDKLVWLLSDRDRPLEVTIGAGALGAARARARWYALDAAELERLGVASVADAWGQDLALSADGEAAAEALLHGWLRALAGPASPAEPFSREHAFVLAAAHARYAGLIAGPGGEVLLDDTDLGRVEAFLMRHAATSQLLRHNLHAAGLIFSGTRHSGTWVATVDGDAITGVVMHARNGHLLLQAPAGAGALARHVVARSGREIAGLVGPRAQVEAARAALGLDDRAVTHDRQELAYALDPADLRLPEALAAGTVRVRRAAPADVETLVGWRGESARPRAQAQLVAARLFVAEVGGAPVATAALGVGVRDTVEVVDVFTAPAERRRGYARCAVSGAVQAAHALGAARAILLVGADHAAARATYQALGFQPAGDHAIAIFDGTDA